MNEGRLSWNHQMALIKAMLGCTDGELECIGERALDEYIADVERIYAKMIDLRLVTIE